MVTKLPKLIAGSVKGHIPALSKGRAHDISGHFMVYTLGQTSAMGNKTIKISTANKATINKSYWACSLTHSQIIKIRSPPEGLLLAFHS